MKAKQQIKCNKEISEKLCKFYSDLQKGSCMHNDKSIWKYKNTKTQPHKNLFFKKNLYKDHVFTRWQNASFSYIMTDNNHD
jgi:hypothetical protein